MSGLRMSLMLCICSADRDIIPFEVVRTKFGLNNDINQKKINQEYKERDRKSSPPKADPFHDGNYEKTIKKSLIDRGKVGPSEVGVELDEKKPGEKVNFEPVMVPQTKTPAAAPKKKKTGQSGAGRPSNSKDVGP